MSELITKDMSEPNDDGIYLLGTDGTNIILPCYAVEGEWNIIGVDLGMAWRRFRSVLCEDAKSHYIESLADHDKRIRREALSLTEEERKQADRVSIECGRMATGGYVLDSQLFYLAKSRERES